MGNKLRIGLLNIMPEAEKYELSVLKLLKHQSIPLELVLIKANHHIYKSSNLIHLEKNYITFDKAIENKKLHGLILTGAPVETMDFENITYWKELLEIFDYAQQHIKSTLGICWGGIAIGKYLGIDKKMLDKKLFGVFTAKYMQRNHWMNNHSNPEFDCPQSRYAGLNEIDLAEAVKSKKIRLLVNSSEAGAFVFESTDERFIAHLGHPEYDENRIIFEYKRDYLKGLNHLPCHFDVNLPVNTWQQDSQDFIGKWLQMINNKIQNCIE